MKDLAGQRFGRLVAVEPVGKNHAQLVVWRCRCDCGREVDVVGASLTKGNTQSCGCLQRESRIADITGERFGRLVALCPTERRVRDSVVWRCQCDCGNLHEAPLTMLRSGKVRSCGCLRAEAHVKDLTGRRFGRLLVLREVGRRNRNVLWECLCDCGNLKEVTTTLLVSGKTRSCGCLRAEAAVRGNKPVDLVGERFGRLLVRERVGTRNRSPLWSCECDCGRMHEATSRELRTGSVRSCGCLPAGAHDLAGKRFGMLVAVDVASTAGAGAAGADAVVGAGVGAAGAAAVAADHGSKAGAGSCRSAAARRGDAARGGDDGALLWRCLCDCGTVVRCTEHELTSGDVASCPNCAASQDDDLVG